jgi:hypothetical protein
MGITRSQYLDWAKRRALSYVDRGHAAFALSFFVDDLARRTETFTPDIGELLRHRQDSPEQIRALIAGTA